MAREEYQTINLRRRYAYLLHSAYEAWREWLTWLGDDDEKISNSRVVEYALQGMIKSLRGKLRRAQQQAGHIPPPRRPMSRSNRNGTHLD